MSNIALTVDTINQLKPLEVVENETVKARFIQIYDTLWGAGTGEAAYERESFYFNNKLRDEEKLQKATSFSVFTSFIDLAVCGLSLEPGTRALCYLQGRNACIGTDASGKKVYEGRLTLTVSGIVREADVLVFLLNVLQYVFQRPMVCPDFIQSLDVCHNTV